ncbi:hypothetical protein [Natrialba sp. INN-245]|uniref:hypothetical protein n=1 Tax=Natrialba sp. INN-245 TaxID=2690967 RepID=UPI00130FFED6|nr:hypothetical protein [Natrialba sp. INN-245]MWV41184.1 hypothetical protein [Natrialba sp. INN-245]
MVDTAPRYEYTATDLEYLDGIKKLGAVSLQARYELQNRYQAITECEATRDKYMALMLLNEGLSRLSRGAFEIDEFGNFDAPDHADAGYAYGKKWAPDQAYLATKYRELWEDVPAELLVDEDDREIKQFTELAAAGSLAYPTDLSGETFDDLEDDRMPSEVYETEVRLLGALVDFHTRFHGWRLFAEEHLDITLDELLDVSAPEEDGVGVTHGVAEIDEQLGENILSLKRDYLQAYPALLEEWTDDAEEVDVDLDARAQNFADGLTDAVDLP